MKLYKTILLFIALLLFAVPALSHHSPYTHNKSGLSFSIGTHHNGLRLYYSNNNRSNYNKYYSNRYSKGFYSKQDKKQKALGSHYPLRPYARTYRNKAYKYNYYPERRIHRQYKHRPYHKAYNRYHSDNRRFNHYSSRHYRKACHPVTKIVTDSQGYYHSIGGTMCYDNYGQGYIVPGSRYTK